ncbi:MAG: hypothetical protein NTV25_00740 [Methanothrix sp.]|nr:hypothetical protein [Methanothrix sp.]
MFWGLFKTMMCFVSLPLRVIFKLSKLAMLIALLILAIMAFKKMLHK